MTCLRSQSQWVVEPEFELQRPMAAEPERLATLSCQNNHVCLLCLGTKHEISHLIFPAAPWHMCHYYPILQMANVSLRNREKTASMGE